MEGGTSCHGEKLLMHQEPLQYLHVRFWGSRGATKGNADTAGNRAALAGNSTWLLLILGSLSLCFQKYTFVATGRTLRVVVRREASFMVGLLLTGPIALTGCVVCPPNMVYLFWKEASVEDGQISIFFLRTKVVVSFLESSEGEGPVWPQPWADEHLSSWHCWGSLG